MSELKIQSSKIKCGGCVKNIEKGLEEFSGITKISIDVASNIVSIEGNELDKTMIGNKITELGYPVV
ncbi:MAG: heavy metal-associated domain-containing protein [Woeseiaceae bacterium]